MRARREHCAMLIGRSQLTQMIPHAGAMCLLDGVRAIDATRIVCTATSHRDAANPLRRKGQLAAVCGVEYAAQAMAAHGAWAQATGAAPRPGMFASLREVTWTCARLDEIEQELTIEAELDADDGRTAAYRFALRAGEALLLRGRATVVFAPAPRA
jgi:predicted hotdog family 3-hydroxylacyl-ACP dehydratase